MIDLSESWWSKRTFGTFSVAALAVLILGCAEAEYADPSMEYAAVATNEVAASAPSTGKGRLTSQVSDSTGRAESIERRLIYSARVSVETPDFDEFAQQLQDRVELLGGFIANYQDQRRTGTRQSGKWTVRVDAAKFNELVSWLDETASVVSKQVSSQDVTEEFVDLAARLANKKNTEARLIKLLDDRPGSLEEVLVVERELDRVREEIERMEGRLRFLSDRVALSTVEITANTRIEYQAQEMVLGQRLRESWQKSLDGLRRTAENTLILFVGLLPWIISFGFISILAVLGYKVLRRRG